MLKSQEESLKLGNRLATPAEVREEMFGNPAKAKSGRPVSGGHLEPPGNPAKERESNSARPALRRERTFDLEPGRSLKDVQVIFSWLSILTLQVSYQVMSIFRNG